MNHRRFSLVSICLVLVAACGSERASAPTPTTTSAFDAARYRSDTPVARGLDRSILTPADLATVSVNATEIPPGTGPRPRPAGPLNVEGIAATFARADALRPALAKAKAGAYHQYAVGTGPILGIRAIAFDDLQAARKFVALLVDATPGIKTTDHPDQHIGVLPVRTLRNPVPSQPGGPSREQAGTYVVYANGVVYFVSFVAPPGTVTDDRVLTVMRAQDDKYQKAKVESEIG